MAAISTRETIIKAIKTTLESITIINLIETVSLGAGGTGYTVDDVLTVVQPGASGGTVTVTSVNAGVITGISLTTGGTGYSVADGLAVTGGTGNDDATINITAIADNEFQTTVAKVLRGIHGEDAFAGNMPGLAIWNEKAPSKPLTSMNRERNLLIHVWGYVEVDAAAGNYDALDKLIADTEKALHSDTYNPNYSRHTELEDLTIYEGGVADPIGIFEMLINIWNDYQRGAP